VGDNSVLIKDVANLNIAKTGHPEATVIPGKKWNSMWNFAMTTSFRILSNSLLTPQYAAEAT
jgi:hypothetical protein